MKRIIGLFVTLMAASLSNTHAESMQEGKAAVRAVRGSAQYSTGGEGWVPLKIGTILRSGSAVKTAADSTVDFFLGANGPVVRVTPDTQMGFDKLAYNKNDIETVVETELNLVNGRILGNVKKLAAASKYEVKFPNGIAGIRGTDYDIKVTPLADGKFDVTVTCITGRIVVASLVLGLDRTAVLGDGDQYSFLTGSVVKLPKVQIEEYSPDYRRNWDWFPSPPPFAEVPLTALVGVASQNSKPPQ